MSERWVRRAGLPEATLGPDSIAILDLTKGRYYGMDATALRIWQLLERPMTGAELETQLMREFDVEADTCRAEVADFIAKLLAEGLIVRDDPATHAES